MFMMLFILININSTVLNAVKKLLGGVLVAQWFGVELVIERSLVRLPAGALSSN